MVLRLDSFIEVVRGNELSFMLPYFSRVRNFSLSVPKFKKRMVNGGPTGTPLITWGNSEMKE